MDAIDLMLLTGEWMLYLLAFILLVRPLVKFDKRFSPLFKYRKQMGWAFGALTAIHVAIYLFLYIDNFKFLLTLFDDLWFQTGLVATVLTIALTVTSNRWSQRKLKTKWKTLHKASYYIGFLGILHGEIASKQTNDMLYVMLVIFALLIVYRYRNLWGTIVTVASIAIAAFMMQPKAVTEVETQVAVVTSKSQEQVDREHQLCGQYGLIYWEPEEVPGFYNCLKEPR